MVNSLKRNTAGDMKRTYKCTQNKKRMQEKDPASHRDTPGRLVVVIFHSLKTTLKELSRNSLFLEGVAVGYVPMAWSPPLVELSIVGFAALHCDATLARDRLL